ncbi:hypothetical protein ACPPVW_08385 [Leifsonia sp. McL0607]|uniref:hypothetical protein n=1 Tax=Leifsonia sp. McL0607 TaxID=3415672 RepID=UPI003CEEF92B
MNAAPIEHSDLAAELWWEKASWWVELTARSKQSIPPSGRDAKDVNIGVGHDVFSQQLSKRDMTPSTRTARTTSI